jgi:hypothetical protein
MIMTTKSKKPNLTTMFARYPRLSSDYKLYKSTIIEKALEGQYARNSESKTLCKVLEISRDYFPYVTEKAELKCLQDRISDSFNNNKSHPQYQKWHKKLPVLFAGYETVTPGKLQAVFNLDDNGMPSSMSVQSSEPTIDTYTIIIKKDSSGDMVFNMNNISQAITMTSLSNITKALG